MDSAPRFPVSLDLPVLGHHNYRALHGADDRQEQIQKDEGVLIELTEKDQTGVEDDPYGDAEREPEHEAPGAAEFCDVV